MLLINRLQKRITIFFCATKKALKDCVFCYPMLPPNKNILVFCVSASPLNCKSAEMDGMRESKVWKPLLSTLNYAKLFFDTKGIKELGPKGNNQAATFPDTHAFPMQRKKATHGISFSKNEVPSTSTTSLQRGALKNVTLFPPKR